MNSRDKSPLSGFELSSASSSKKAEGVVLIRVEQQQSESVYIHSGRVEILNVHSHYLLAPTPAAFIYLNHFGEMNCSWCSGRLAVPGREQHAAIHMYDKANASCVATITSNLTFIMNRVCAGPVSNINLRRHTWSLFVVHARRICTVQTIRSFSYWTNKVGITRDNKTSTNVTSP
jgi:hypothetical protein